MGGAGWLSTAQLTSTAPGAPSESGVAPDWDRCRGGGCRSDQEGPLGKNCLLRRQCQVGTVMNPQEITAQGGRRLYW